MKYIAYSFFISILIIIGTITVEAAEDRQPKTVSGKVRYEDTSVAKNVIVTITCKNTTLTDDTSINGNYSVTFANLECEQFDTVTASAVDNSLSGSQTKEVTFALGQNMEDIILASEAPVSVPEFGTFSAILAVSTSLLAYSRIKMSI